MRKKKKTKFIYISLIVLILIIGMVYVFLKVSETTFGSTIPLNAQRIEIKESSTINSYLCNDDYCKIIAYMKITKPSGLDTWECDPSPSCTPESFNSMNECLDGQVNCYQKLKGNYKSNCRRGCTQDTFKFYKASFGLSPSFLGSFPFDDEFEESSEAQENYIDTSDNPIVLLRGQSVNFYPKNFDGTNVQYKKLKIERWDTSCTKAISAGTNCDPFKTDKVYCNPTYECPSGYSYAESIDCIYYENKWSNRLYNDICSKDVSGKTYCEPYINYKKGSHYKCDINVITLPSGAKCNKWSTTLTIGDSREECKRTSDNKIAAGVGTISCPNLCSNGARNGTTGQTSYQQCNLIGSCSGGWQYNVCPSGEGGQLLYDNSVKNCVFDSRLSCNGVNDVIKCGLNKIDYQECKLVNDIDLNGKPIQDYQWKDTPGCPTNKLCSKINGISSCNCNGVSNSCSANQTKCSGSTKYYPCDTSKQCPIFSTTLTGVLADEGEYCDTSTNTLKTKETCAHQGGDTYCQGIDSDTICDTSTNSDGICVKVGCDYPNGPNYARDYKCSDSKDTNNVKIEKCSDNECIPNDDIFQATSIEFGTSQIRCYNNKIYGFKTASKYTTKFNTIYRWELITDCTLTTEKYCLGDSLI